MAFAVYKVFLFAKNKDLKGYSRRISLIFTIVILSIVFITFLVIPRYQWNDNLGYYCKKVFTESCFCESNKKIRKECEDNRKKQQEETKKEDIKKPNKF